jgi:threonine/homoserine/homoserine lactone efflux protein
MSSSQLLGFIATAFYRHRAPWSERAVRGWPSPGQRAPYRRAQVLAPSGQPHSDVASFTQGFTVGATNLKTVVFLTATLPQLVSRPAGNVPTRILLLAAVGLGFLASGRKG